VLSGRGLCDELIARPEESYRLCCVVVCDLETSRMGAPCTYDISRLRVKFDFDVHVTVHRDKFLIIKPTRCTNFSNLFFGRKLYMFRTDPLSIISNFFIVHTAMVYVIQVCWQLVSRIRMFHPDPARKLSANQYDTYHCCVYSEKHLMMDRETVRNM